MATVLKHHLTVEKAIIQLSKQKKTVIKSRARQSSPKAQEKKIKNHATGFEPRRKKACEFALARRFTLSQNGYGTYVPLPCSATSG